VILLKLQKRELSPETKSAITQISKFIALLSAYYMKDQKNELFKDEEEIV